jgi:hypothetical protein
MSQLPNPNQGKPFDKVYKDEQGKPVWGERGEEIVHIPTGKSNQSYYKPETVVNSAGCKHEFNVSDMGKREIMCRKCSLETTFHAGAMKKIRGKDYVILQNKSYLIEL